MVRDQVELYDAPVAQKGNTLRETGLPIIVVTTLGVKSGKIRKIPLMRVDTMVSTPSWHRRAVRRRIRSGTTTEGRHDPIEIQDGAEPAEYDVREVSGEERAAWWERSVAAYPPYAEYQRRPSEIPVCVASPATDTSEHHQIDVHPGEDGATMGGHIDEEVHEQGVRWRRRRCQRSVGVQRFASVGCAVRQPPRLAGSP